VQFCIDPASITLQLHVPSAVKEHLEASINGKGGIIAVQLARNLIGEIVFGDKHRWVLETRPERGWPAQQAYSRCSFLDETAF
jgi:hypothetical protein